MPTALQRARILGVAAALSIATLALAGCQPEPTPSASSSPTPTASAAPSPSATGSPTPTLGPDDITLPADCDSIYSPAMRAALEAADPPLNDPGLTLGSSQIVEALELLDSGIPTLRCTWGVPSEQGLATNVSLIAQEQAQELIVALQAVGFLCDPVASGTLCALERTTIDLDDNQVSLGESHFFRGNGWVSTSWVGFIVDGYTEDVAATLWG
ncbi:hypothetical protein [Microbacterium sp. RU33B]|uniref:hypothetical protein n=1 Tax=Microbacterium sp. RU33B TaxID=1907390 RepID=UPI000964F2F2|nr:hypothetical protein [Microbacterium sp. RU33B]SIT77975.1 hypothetical protein SAMN05880545_1830 [Microbacterium sp. RU33B]